MKEIEAYLETVSADVKKPFYAKIGEYHTDKHGEYHGNSALSRFGEEQENDSDDDGKPRKLAQKSERMAKGSEQTARRFGESMEKM